MTSYANETIDPQRCLQGPRGDCTARRRTDKQSADQSLKSPTSRQESNKHPHVLAKHGIRFGTCVTQPGLPAHPILVTARTVESTSLSGPVALTHFDCGVTG